MSNLTGEVQNTTVMLQGSVQKGLPVATPIDIDELTQQVVEAMPTVSAVDFSNFDNGSFKETVDGSVITYPVTFDNSGRPTAIGNITIRWEA